jgi:hypothetical protein
MPRSASCAEARDDVVLRAHHPLPEPALPVPVHHRVVRHERDEEVAVRHRLLEVPHQKPAQPVLERQRHRRLLGDLAPKPVADVLGHGGEDLFLGVEVPVDGTRRVARAARDLVHGRAVKALSRENRNGRLDEREPRLRRLPFLASHDHDDLLARVSNANGTVKPPSLWRNSPLHVASIFADRTHAAMGDRGLGPGAS